LERLTPFLDKECVKILHITGAHWLFQNSAEYARLLSLQQRRGVTLRPRRIVPPSLGIEHANYATTWGNEFTIGTFSYARKAILRLPVPSTSLYPWSEDKDYSRQRKNFLWFGNVGMVHKGLDVVLEAFAQMPDYHLTVCGDVKNEEDFEATYHKELYQRSNIESVGWVDTDSARFKEITDKCVGVIHPSCSEGCSGSVVTCLHAGLIPIVSYESGIDVWDFGLILKESSVEEIIQGVKAISDLSAVTLKERSRKAWEFARAFYTKENYVACYSDFVTNVLGLRRKG
jgi:glycosyltransferase involved in cell wall biosynthesis